ncbi:MAG TPA: polyphosphate kinase 2 family protein [Vicinamibacterales bacterium]|nr:polyphosphate kinase 2 family protein [Vicinamibacterales bacterium]
MNDRQFRALAKPYIVREGRRFRLKEFDPQGPGRAAAHQGAKKFLKKSVEVLSELQEKLYAQDRWGVLLIFQAMDAAGKDSAIKHVMSGIDPKGCQVYSFKSPSSEELDHDFMWRTSKCLPERGRIGIFNRSYYEETLVVRVHPEFLGRQKLPTELITPRIWRERFQDINAFERYLARNGFVIRKFFLNVSRAEQRRRFLERLERPEKNWKFSMGDLAERSRWRSYMTAYEETIRATATPHAPWVVIPGDDKKFARTVVAAAVIDALNGLNLQFPTLDAEQQQELTRARRLLRQESRRTKS